MDTPVKNYEELYKNQLPLIGSLKEENRTLKEQLAWLKKQVFGQKSERIVDLGEEYESLDLDLGSTEVANSEPSPKTEHVEYYRRKPTAKGKGSCTLKIPEGIEVVEIVKDLPEDQRFHPVTGEALVEIDRYPVDKLAVKPGTFYIKRFIYVKYAVPGNSLAGVIQPPADDSMLKGSKFDESFMAYVVSEKLCYHTPFYRQHERLLFDDIEVESRTLSQLLKNLGSKMEPLYNEMKKVVFGYKYLFSDDTPLRMLNPGAGKTKETRMWVYECALPNAPPYKIYEFTVNRKYEHPKKFLKGFKGTIHADAYGSYVDLDADKHIPISWAGCWVHARRKFLEAEAGDMELRLKILRMIRALFRFEKIAWKYEPNIRLKIRQEHEKPIVNTIFDILKEKLRTDILFPKERMTIAINYLLRYEKNFRKYLDDANVRMDNNSAERAVRKVILGRNNWLFIGSPTAGKSMGILYSFVQSCRAMKIDPQKYLEDVFRRFNSHPHKNLRELLPDQWKKAQQTK